MAEDHIDKFYCSDKFYAIIFWATCIPIVLLREIKDLKLLSFLLFGGVFLFILIFMIVLCMDGAIPHSEPYYKVYLGRDLLTAVSVILVAYGF